MKKNHGLFCLLFSLCVSLCQAQNNVGINTTTPHASAALDVTSTAQGILVPRMLQDQRNAISSPATGLMIYQTDNTPGFYYYNGTAWTAIAGSGGTSLPAQSGNSGKALTTNGASASWTQVTPYMAKTTGTQLVNTSSPTYTTIAGITLEAGKTYLLSGQIFGYRAGGTNAPMTVRLRYTGTAATDLGVTFTGSLINGTVFNNSGTHDSEAAGFGISATATNGQRYDLRCYLTTTTSGTFYIETARTTTNVANDFYISTGSYLMATPIQ